MPTTNVSSACELQLQEIADALSKSKKVVVITGAGISTNCGIPVSFPDNFQTIELMISIGFQVGKRTVYPHSSPVRCGCSEQAERQLKRY